MAIAWLRNRNVWLLVGGILAVIAVADLSGMSKAEVERIWLPFVPWLMLATVAFAGNARVARTRVVQTWLGVQGASALLLEVAVRSKW